MTEEPISFSARLWEVFGKVHQEPKVARYLAREADARAERIAMDAKALEMLDLRAKTQEAVHALAMDIRLLQSML
jgi:hypothetical protein